METMKSEVIKIVTGILKKENQRERKILQEKS